MMKMVSSHYKDNELDFWVDQNLNSIGIQANQCGRVD